MATAPGKMFERLRRPVARARETAGNLVALVAEGGDEFGAAAVDDSAQVVELHADRGGEFGAARGEPRIRVGRGVRQRPASVSMRAAKVASASPAARSSEPVSVSMREASVASITPALRSAASLRSTPRLDDARGLVGRFGKRAEAAVERFGAAPRRNRRARPGSCRRRRRSRRDGPRAFAEVRPLAVEQLRDALLMRRDPALELPRPMSKRWPTSSRGPDHLVLEPLHARAERARHVVDAVSRDSRYVLREAGQRLRSARLTRCRRSR